jgi:hypothetical protein
MWANAAVCFAKPQAAEDQHLSDAQLRRVHPARSPSAFTRETSAARMRPRINEETLRRQANRRFGADCGDLFVELRDGLADLL